jgi:hypothetical protein
MTLSSAELNYDVYEKEMLAVLISLRKNRHYLQGAVHKPSIYSDHQNRTNLKSAILHNQRQAGWSEELKQYNIQLLYRKGASIAKAYMLSQCPAFTFRERGKTSTINQTMSDKEQWLKVGAMENDLDGYKSIQILAMEVALLSPEAKERIKEKAMLDEKYRELCKQVKLGGNVDKTFSVTNELVGGKNGINVPEGLRQGKMQSEHDSNIAGHFGRY